jgi:DNA-binding MarR family transcriptional regulator
VKKKSKGSNQRRMRSLRDDYRESRAERGTGANRQYGYRLAEIADYLGVHPATVSRRLKQAELAHE